MPGRYLQSVQTKRNTVRDAVSSDPILTVFFMTALVACVYGTVVVTDLILPPHGATSETKTKQPSSTTLNGMPDYIVGAIPFFFVMMAIEAVLLRIGDVTPVAAQYSTVDTWSSLTAGTSQTLVSLLAKPFIPLTAVYCWIWDHYALTDAFSHTDSVVVAALCFIFGDFFYYWFHRTAHEVHVLWAGHSVHHSSERYNLSTALRQSWQQAIFSILAHLPAALFLPPRSYVLWQQWVTLYQFWVHTCVVRRLPWIIELIFVTPSHHRMHHDRRIHKNFAGVFILWDRWFGTFQDEFADTVHAKASSPDELVAAQDATIANDRNEEIAYFGIMDVTVSWADSVPQLLMWRKICRLGKTPLLAFRHAWYGPGYFTTTKRRPLPATCDDNTPRIRADSSRVTLRQKVVVMALFMWSLYGLIAVLIRASKLDTTMQSISILILLMSLTNQGLIFDQRRIVVVLEAIRCVICIMLCNELPFDFCGEIHSVLLIATIVAGPHLF